MNRAVLLIGVSHAGDLGKLKAVEASIDAMQAWARGQGIPEDQIIRRTDVDGPVTIAGLFNDVKALADRDTINQLIVYFAGHGVINNRLEFWLLSDAPVNAAAAVNVNGNIALAQAGAFEHVVFLSDACRTPTQGVQYSRIIGSDIFPNIEDTERERSVDIFFGTSLGAPALEVLQTETGNRYQAMFTEALLDALNGKIPEIIVDGRVRARPMKRALPKQVWDKIRSSGLTLATSQTPDARITSDDDAWLAEIPPPVAGASTSPAGGGAVDIPPPGPSLPPDALPPMAPAPPPPPPPSPAPQPASAQPEPLSTREVAQLVVEEALHSNTYGRVAATSAEVESLTGRSLSKNAGRFLESMAQGTGNRRPQAMPDKPGFEIHGRRLASASCPDGACHVSDDGDATTVSVDVQAPQSQVLLEFDDGTGVLLPVIREYVGILSFRERGLDEVWYEPADEFYASMSRQELDFLRQAIMKASSLGVFAIESGDADQLASRMQNVKFQDPALAVYAAYAYHDLGQFRRIHHMQEFLKNHIGVQLFDLALLSRDLLKDASIADGIVPRLPLLSQGWALVGALRGRIPGQLEMLRKELEPSLWSLYAPEGVQAIRTWLREHEEKATLSATGAMP